MFIAKKIPPDIWKQGLGEYAHAIAFDRKLSPEMERLDYALLCVETNTNSPVGYVTVREFDHETVYWRFGGAFPLIKATAQVVPAFGALMQYEFDRGIKRVTFVVENTNKPMLKLALYFDFKIIGVRNFNSSILLEHLKEF